MCPLLLLTFLLHVVPTKTLKFGNHKQNRPIGMRIPVDSLFLTWGKVEFVEHYVVLLAYHL